MAVAEVHEAVMEMTFVSRGDARPISRPADYREQRVKNRHTENYKRDEKWSKEEVRLPAELVPRSPADGNCRGGHQQSE